MTQKNESGYINLEKLVLQVGSMPVNKLPGDHEVVWRGIRRLNNYIHKISKQSEREIKIYKLLSQAEMPPSEGDVQNEEDFSLESAVKEKTQDKLPSQTGISPENETQNDKRPPLESAVKEKIQNRFKDVQKAIIFAAENPSVSGTILSGAENRDDVLEKCLPILGFPEDGEAKELARDYFRPALNAIFNIYRYYLRAKDLEEVESFDDAVERARSKYKAIYLDNHLEEILERVNEFKGISKKDLLVILTDYVRKFYESYGEEEFSRRISGIKFEPKEKLWNFFSSLLNRFKKHMNTSGFFEFFEPKNEKISPRKFIELPEEISDTTLKIPEIRINEDRLKAESEILIYRHIKGKYDPRASERARNLEKRVRSEYPQLEDFSYGGPINHINDRNFILRLAREYARFFDIEAITKLFENESEILETDEELWKRISNIVGKDENDRRLFNRFYEESNPSKEFWVVSQLHHLNEFLYGFPSDSPILKILDGGIVQEKYREFSEMVKKRYAVGIFEGDVGFRPHFPLKRYLNGLKKRLSKYGPFDLVDLKIRNNEIPPKDMFVFPSDLRYPLFEILPKEERYAAIGHIFQQSIISGDPLEIEVFKCAFKELDSRWREYLSSKKAETNP